MPPSQRYHEKAKRHALYATGAGIVAGHLLFALIYCIHSQAGGPAVMLLIIGIVVSAFVVWVEGSEAARLRRRSALEARWENRQPLP